MISKLKAGMNKRVGGAVAKISAGVASRGARGRSGGRSAPEAYVDDVFAMPDHVSDEEGEALDLESQPMFVSSDAIIMQTEESEAAVVPEVARNCGYPVPTDGELIGLFVVDFHPTEGPIVEWSYPVEFTKEEMTRQGLSFPALDPWDTKEVPSSFDVREVFPYLAFLSLPDMAHLVAGDAVSYVYFVLPCSQGLVYGISIYGALKDSRIKRGTVQKAVCVLSRAPFFGHLRIRLMPMAKAFFDESFSRDLLAEWWDSLRLSLHNLQETELFEDLGPAFLLLLRGLSRGKLMQILRALLLESKVVVYSTSSAVCSAVVLALCSMLPGVSWLGYNSHGFGRRNLHYKLYSFPLQIFHSRCAVYPYVSLEMLDDLIQMRGCLIGTTNKLLISNSPGNPIDPSVVLTLPDDFESSSLASLSIRSKELNKLSHATASERVVQKKIHGNVEDLAARRNSHPPLEEANAAPTQLQDPVDLILCHSADGDRKPGKHFEEVEMDTFSLNMVSDVRQQLWNHAEQWTRVLAYWSGEERSVKQAIDDAQFGKQCRKQLSRYGTDFFVAWTTTTESGKKFIQSHQHPTHVPPTYPPRSGRGEHILPNGDTYQGNFEHGRRHGEGIYSSPSKRLRYHGKWQDDKRHGQGVLTIEDKHGKQIMCYDGTWEADRRHGNGVFYECCLKHEKYSGQWSKDQYHGTGNHVTKDGVVYEGEWNYGKYHGLGKLKFPNGDLYSGNFEDGSYHGIGNLWWENNVKFRFYIGSFYRGEMHGQGHLSMKTQDYEGHWNYGRRHGHGILTHRGGDREDEECSTVEGTWFNDKPGFSTHQEFLVLYKNGDTYTGALSLDAKKTPLSIPCDGVFLVPHGAGIYKGKGTVNEGTFTEYYEGNFQYGMRHGNGSLLCSMGAKFERKNGIFDMGDFISACVACESDVASSKGSSHTCGRKEVNAKIEAPLRSGKGVADIAKCAIAEDSAEDDQSDDAENDGVNSVTHASKQAKKKKLQGFFSRPKKDKKDKKDEKDKKGKKDKRNKKDKEEKVQRAGAKLTNIRDGVDKSPRAAMRDAVGELSRSFKQRSGGKQQNIQPWSVPLSSSQAPSADVSGVNRLSFDRASLASVESLQTETSLTSAGSVEPAPSRRMEGESQQTRAAGKKTPPQPVAVKTLKKLEMSNVGVPPRKLSSESSLSSGSSTSSSSSSSSSSSAPPMRETGSNNGGVGAAISKAGASTSDNVPPSGASPDGTAEISSVSAAMEDTILSTPTECAVASAQIEGVSVYAQIEGISLSAPNEGGFVSASTEGVAISVPTESAAVSASTESAAVSTSIEGVAVSELTQGAARSASTEGAVVSALTDDADVSPAAAVPTQRENHSPSSANRSPSSRGDNDNEVSGQQTQQTHCGQPKKLP
eukprot:GEMP01001220.1.p1 GENE.GEMP01001220.1~~GEMP01001220.1.p1  ORF type:complete len:1389 (+),score=289.60 GEMP01001220.1:155-4321(+)